MTSIGEKLQKAGVPPRVSVGFSVDEQARLEELAARYERSVPFIIRRAVRHYLSRANEPQLAFDLGGDEQ